MRADPINIQPSPVDDGDGDDGLDPREYWRVIARYKWSILGIGLVAALVTAVFVYSLEPVFRASTTLLIESKPGKVVSVETVYEVGRGNRKYFETQFELLKSRTLAEKVVDRLKLWEEPEFDTAAPRASRAPLQLDWKRFLPDWLDSPEAPPVRSESDRRRAAVGRLLRRISVDPVLDSQLVRVSVEAYEPALAARMADALADSFIEAEFEARLKTTGRAAAWLTGRLEELKAKVDESERALQAFREDAKLVDASGVQTMATGQLAALSERLVAARETRLQSENIHNQIKDLEGAAASRFESIPAVLKHPLIQGLKVNEAAAESRVSELAKRYGPQHPKMIAARSELANARRSLRARVVSVVAGVQKDYEIAKANERDLLAAMEDAKSKVQDVNRKQYRNDALEREVQANRQLYDMFLVRFKETSATSDMESALARVVDTAVVPSTPVKPNKRKAIAYALLLGLLVATGLAFLLDRLDNTLVTVHDVEKKLGLPVFGQLPKLKTRGRRDRAPLRHFLDDSQSSFAEATRTVRTGVLLSSVDKVHKIILVTSSLPGEGKSTVSMNLAFAIGQLEKVLLIDGDMRRPSIGEVCNMAADARGLSHFVAGTAEISQCVYPIEGTNVHVMPAGVVPPNPQELISSRRFSEILERLSKVFDRIIIDSAPALLVSDAIVLARHASTVVYVVKSDSTPFQVARAVTRRMRALHGQMIGVVLNQVEPRRPSRYGRYGYYTPDYHSYYGYEKT